MKRLARVPPQEERSHTPVWTIWQEKEEEEKPSQVREAWVECLHTPRSEVEFLHVLAVGASRSPQRAL